MDPCYHAVSAVGCELHTNYLPLPGVSPNTAIQHGEGHGRWNVVMMLLVTFLSTSDPSAECECQWQCVIRVRVSVLAVCDPSAEWQWQ